jgi:hypothetical protein
MIEDAFRYRGSERFVGLGFGVNGGTMSGGSGETTRPPKSPTLFRDFLRHPVIRPHTEAFQLETDEPTWIQALKEEVNKASLLARDEEVKRWFRDTRCLLLDRGERQFYVGTITEVRSWLILRSAVFKLKRQPKSEATPKCRYPEQAMREWLDSQPLPDVPAELVREWNRKFAKRQAVSGCVGAAATLGFSLQEVDSMVEEAFRSSPI